MAPESRTETRADAAANPRARFHHARAGGVQGWLLVATCWLASAGAVLIAPVLPFMQQDFATTPHAAVWTMAALVVPGLMIALFGPVAGAVVDRLGRKRPYMLAVAVYAVAGSLPFWLDDLHAIVASRVVVGLAEALINTVATALTANYFQGVERQKWMTLQHGSSAIVAVLMFTAGGVMGGLPAGWRAPFLVYGGAIVFLPLIGIFLWEPRTEHRAPRARRAPFPWRAIGHLCAMTVLASVMFFVVPVQISFVLHGRGASSPALIGLGGALANAGIPVGAFAFHRLAAWAINRLLAVAFALFAAGFGVVAGAHGVGLTIAGAFIACMGAGMALPLLEAWVMARVPFGQSGRAAGGYMGSFFLGNFLSPLAVAGVAAYLGGLPACLALFGCVCGVAALAMLVSAALGRGPNEPVQAVLVPPLPA